ncbi:twin-arginine translocation signal domain-containing protein, partial [Nocardia sp. NPDC059154]
MLNPLGTVPRTGIPAQLAAQMTMDEQYDWHRSYLKRHRVSRRTFLRGSAAAAMAAGLGSAFGGRGVAYADDAPLTVGGRRVGYGTDAASQLRFSAQLSRNPGATKVFLDHGPTPALGSTLEA